jgi:hypothetical protein
MHIEHIHNRLQRVVVVVRNLRSLLFKKTTEFSLHYYTTTGCINSEAKPDAVLAAATAKAVECRHSYHINESHTDMHIQQ